MKKLAGQTLVALLEGCLTDLDAGRIATLRKDLKEIIRIMKKHVERMEA